MPSMIAPLRRAVQVAAERRAVSCGDVELTYAECWERCRRLAGALDDLGVHAGERVAVVAPNCHRYLELYQAVPASGRVLVPLNQRHSSAELAYAMADSGAKVLFTALEVDGVPDGVEHVVDLSMTDGYEALLHDATPTDFPTALPEDTLAGLFYTGGTTGAAKGVMLTHRNLVANAFHFQACWPFDADTSWLVAAPMFHAAGTIAVLATIWHGGHQVMLPAFEPAASLDLIEAHGVTATLVVPSMLAAMSEEQLARPRDIGSLRLIAHGGAPSATETLRRAHSAFPDAELLHIYGATETSPIATMLQHEERILDGPQAGSCGQPAVGVDVEIMGPGGELLPRGEVGEVVIRGPNVMVGYWNKPDETAAALRAGWYRTGDLGYMDEDAFVFLVDRVKDMIVTGGENVYSMEVEEALYRHPAVLEAAVFGIPHERWGEAVHAVVVLRAPVSEDELIQHCKVSIAGYKVPKRVEFSAEPLPKSGAGKLLKRELRAPYWKDEESMVSGA